LNLYVKQGEGRMNKVISIVLSISLSIGLFSAIIPFGFSTQPQFLWQHTYGGTGDDEIRCVIKTNDCGYALAGFTKSSGAGGWDGWLVKTDASGKQLWNKTYGGSDSEKFFCVVQTTDGGFALVGGANGFVSGLPRTLAWLVKTDDNGNVLWNKTYGDVMGDMIAYSLVERTSEGFVFAGLFNDRSMRGGQYAFWIVTDASGNILGNIHLYPGPLYNWVDHITYAGSGEYFLVGYCLGSFALWKIDQNGNLIWDPPKTFGRGLFTGSEAVSAVQTDDGGCLLVGTTWNIVLGDWPHYVWVVKTDADGNHQWDRLYPGSHSWAYDVVRTVDGGYALAGCTDVNGFGRYDVLLLKLDSNGNGEWDWTCGGAQDDRAYSLVQTSTGGFVVAGFTRSFGAGNEDAYLVNFGPPLTVSIIPSAVAMRVSNSVTFSSSVSGGTPSYSYQWYLNGTAVSGETSDSWTFTPTLAAFYLAYLKITDNSSCTQQSNTVPIHVAPDLSVSIFPISTVMDVGQSQTFSSVVSEGTIPYTYQWFLDGIIVPEATSANWTFTPSSTDNYNVFLNVTDATSLEKKSNVATVTVNPLPNASITPTSAVINIGMSQTFTSTVSGGTPPYTYKWFANDTMIVGATCPSIIFTPDSDELYRIYLNLTDSVEATVKSNEALLTVNPMLTVSIEPTSATITLGQSVTFSSVTSGGTPPYTLKWYLNGTEVSGVTSSSWIFTPTATGHHVIYLNVTDSVSQTAKSNEASVMVAPPLTVSISPTSASILVGQSVTFTSTVSGGYTPYSYQWYLNGAPVSGATAASWTFTPTTAGIYYVHLKVTDAKGNTAQSDTARITVATVPVGGYSFPIQVHTKTEPIIPYIALIATLTAIFTKLRPKTKRKH
jgi:hypothetical protein